MLQARTCRALAGLALVAMLAAPLTRAAPLPEDERIPVDVRRTTLIVRDIDRSLAFWRDALGLTVVYDQVIVRPGLPDQPPGTERSMRLALLRANDDFVGVIGLLEYQNPRLPDPGLDYARPGLGDVILVVNAADLEQRFEKARAVPGVRVVSEPSVIEYPAPGGEGTIPVLVSVLYDPDGYFVELNKLLGQAAGTQ
ncbi:MAG TPA: VOC family protein [Steroidobacteraceae bacterium]|nr:VOC family protein [Steroidobacteraceae bacterium]